MKRATEKVLKKMASNGYPEVREALDDIERLIKQADLLAANFVYCQDETNALRGLLREWLDDGIIGPRDLEMRTREALGNVPDAERSVTKVRPIR
jgi:transcriptional accessory protein Tex/SPT6